MIERKCLLNVTRSAGSFWSSSLIVGVTVRVDWEPKQHRFKGLFVWKEKINSDSFCFKLKRDILGHILYGGIKNPRQRRGGLVLKNVLQGELRRHLFCLRLLVFSQGIDFVLSYTWYYERKGYLFTSPNQAWLGRAISAVMKSIFQARSTMVRSPAPRPLIKETFPPFWGVRWHPQAQGSTLKHPLSGHKRVGNLSRGLSSLAWCQAATVVRRSWRTMKLLCGLDKHVIWNWSMMTVSHAHCEALQIK